MKKVTITLIVMVIVFLACRKEDFRLDAPSPTPASIHTPVTFDINTVPYNTLSQYHFFQGPLADLSPVYGVLPYDVITPLFSDYAHKKRFIWMPAGTHATYVDDHTVLDFMDGTVLIKNFYYDRVQPGNLTRILETRLLIKKAGQWIFADYVWNTDQTEATLDMNGSYVPLDWLDNNNIMHSVDYRIPSAAECHTCHKKYDVSTPIGPKPQNINSNYSYPTGVMNQMSKWVDMGYLSGGYPSNILTTVKWDDPTKDLTERVRSYLDMNCAHCHSDGGHCAYRPMRFPFYQTTDPTNMGVCVVPDDPLIPQLTHIITSGNTERSLLYYRINSTDESVRMPLLGRTVIHQEGVQMIGDWINSLSPPCQ